MMAETAEIEVTDELVARCRAELTETAREYLGVDRDVLTGVITLVGLADAETDELLRELLRNEIGQPADMDRARALYRRHMAAAHMRLCSAGRA
jgi:hypothetical protein